MYSKLTTCLLSGALALSLVACNAQETTKEPEAEQPKQEVVEKKTDDAADKKAEEKQTPASEEKAAEKQTLGTKEDGSYEVALTNKLGGKITSICVQTIDDQQYSENLLKNNATIAKDEEVTLYVSAPKDANATDEAYACNVKVKVEGKDAEQELTLPLVSKSMKATLMQEGNVSYVDYVNDKGEKGSTKEIEESFANAVDEGAAQGGTAGSNAVVPESVDTNDVAAPAPVVEEAAAPVAEPAPAPAPEPVAEPVVEVAPEPVAEPVVEAPVEAPSAPAQGEDACVGDVVLRY